MRFFHCTFLCVYLPYDCSDNHDDYMFYLSKLFQVIDEFQSPYIFVCGDFNAIKGVQVNLVMIYCNFVLTTLYV